MCCCFTPMQSVELWNNVGLCCFYAGQYVTQRVALFPIQMLICFLWALKPLLVCQALTICSCTISRWHALNERCNWPTIRPLLLFHRKYDVGCGKLFELFVKRFLIVNSLTRQQMGYGFQLAPVVAHRCGFGVVIRHYLWHECTRFRVAPARLLRGGC